MGDKMNKKLVQLESILLISDKALHIRELAKKLKLDKKEIKELIENLTEKFNQENSGIHILNDNRKIQFTTNPISEGIIKEFIKEELNSNLSDASMETLTIIAYRGPITKSELEQIRGVNCSVILKNLLIRNLIEGQQDKEKMTETYSTNLEFLKYLGINKVEELPDYEKLNSNEIIDKILNDNEDETETEEEKNLIEEVDSETGFKNLTPNS
jgi:segregation and condensation protein B